MNEKKIKVGVVGATGYGGMETVRLLAGHGAAEVAAVGSVSYEGKKLSDVYPNLYGICDLTLLPEDAVVAASDVVIAALPHGLSEKLAKKCLAAGKKLIDLGADFRLDSAEAYRQWYGKAYENPAIHAQSYYCIPELHRGGYAGQPIIANPGCYPTSAALGLAPLAAAGLLKPNGLIIDSKSGVTGAGKGLADNTHYPNCNEAFSPYKIAAHRHTPEIEQTLSKLCGQAVKVTFVPHLLPLNRGIVSTMYADLRQETDAAELHALYRSFYDKERFVRVRPLGTVANLRDVKLSNYCDISVHADGRTGRAIIVAAIDNMVKGAAGQAIQNLNLMFGFPEETGLTGAPTAF